MYQLLDSTNIQTVTGGVKRDKNKNELINSRHSPYKYQNHKITGKSVIKSNDYEEESNSKRLNTNYSNDNVKESIKLKQLQEENQKLKIRIKAMEQASKSLAFNDDIQEENRQLKEEIEKKEEELQQLQAKYDKKNRENIENKSKAENLQFDVELLQSKISVIIC